MIAFAKRHRLINALRELGIGSIVGAALAANYAAKAAPTKIQTHKLLCFIPKATIDWQYADSHETLLH